MQSNSIPAYYCVVVVIVNVGVATTVAVVVVAAATAAAVAVIVILSAFGCVNATANMVCLSINAYMLRSSV